MIQVTIAVLMFALAVFAVGLWAVMTSRSAKKSHANELGARLGASERVARSIAGLAPKQ